MDRLVYYVIASPKLFSLQPTLKAHDLQPGSDHCPLTFCIQVNMTVPRDCTERAPIAQRLLLEHYPKHIHALREVLASTMPNQIPGIDLVHNFKSNIACKYCASLWRVVRLNLLGGLM